MGLGQTPPLCALFSPPPLPSVPFSWPLLLSPPHPPLFLSSLSLLPCFAFPHWCEQSERGKSPGAGLWSSSAHTHPLHRAQREKRRQIIPAGMSVAAPSKPLETVGGSNWQNWDSGGATGWWSQTPRWPVSWSGIRESMLTHPRL